MRKFLLAMSIAAVVASGLPTAHGATAPQCSNQTAGGKTKRVCTLNFAAALPGTVLTPYWGTDPLDDGTLGYGTCAKPSPDQSVDQRDFTVPSSGTLPNWNLLVFEIDPELDYDSFICEIGDTANANGIPDEILATGANNVTEACDGVLGEGDPTGMGCKEKSSIPVVEGKTYRLRVYNWLDAPNGALPCPGKITLSHVG